MKLFKASKQKQTTRGFDLAITIILASIFFLVPLFFSVNTIQGLGFEKTFVFFILTLLGLAVWIGKAFYLKRFEFKRSILDLPIAALLLVSTITTILSISPKDSLLGSFGSPIKGLIGILTVTIFYYLLRNNVTIERIKLYFWALLSSFSLIFIYSLLQISGVFILPIEALKTASFNPLGSLTSLSALAVAVLPLFVIAASQLKALHPNLSDRAANIIRICLGIGLLLDLAIIFLLSNFAFLPAALAGFVVLLLFMLSKIVRGEENGLTMPLAVFFLLIIMLVLGSFNLVKLKLDPEVGLSLGATWEITKASLKENPIFGSGPSTFYYDTNLYRSQELNLTPAWSSRFDAGAGAPLEVLATTGILGFVAFAVVIVLSLFSIYNAIYKGKDEAARLLLLGFFASMVTAILYSFASTLNTAANLVYLLISVIAVAFANELLSERKNIDLSFDIEPKQALGTSAIFLGLSAGILVLVIMGTKAFAADIYAAKSFKAKELSERAERINRSIALLPYQENYFLELSDAELSLANEELQKKDGNQGLAKEYFAAAIAAAEKAKDIAPNNAAVYENLAMTYETVSSLDSKMLDKAEEAYRKLGELDPITPIPSLRIALINVARANAAQEPAEKEKLFDEAIKNYDEAIKKKIDLPSAYYGKAVVYQNLGKNDEAIEEIKKSVVSSNNKPEYLFELGRAYYNRATKTNNLNQDNSAEIVKGESQDELSVENQGGANLPANSEDLQAAEQIFLNIISTYPEHANSLYSLALIYKTAGNTENGRKMVGKLLETVKDEESQKQIKEQFPGLY